MTVRQEYPRPQFVRADWQNLNGRWEFAFDDEDRGLIERWYEGDYTLGDYITVPFVYQAKYSGIGTSESHDIVWYKRGFEVNVLGDKQVLLHFGAVDYKTQVFVNGHLAVCHTGGHTPFLADITPYLIRGLQTVVLRIYDPHKNEEIPRGKQFWEEESRGIWYTNSTGIWQTVWLEYVSKKRVDNVRFISLFEEGKMNILCRGHGVCEKDVLKYQVSRGEEEIAQGEIHWHSQTLDFEVDLIQNQIFRTNFHEEGLAWTPEHPTLFTVKLYVKDELGNISDEVESYFGFRKVHTENGMIYLNNKPYYQKLVLDQGYWPEGLLTAPEDKAFQKDIELAKSMGFNGCRKHQKMEDPRFLYWADRMGFLVWGECASAPIYSPQAAENLMKEWGEVVERDFNHPSIIVWVPLNESWGVPNIHSSCVQQHFSQTMYHYLHAVDQTRLVISNDGWEMTETDICAIHNYMHGHKEESEKYQEYCEALSTKEALTLRPSTCWDIYAKGFQYGGEPILLTEFGGIGYDVSGKPGWGYTSVENEAEFLADYARIMKAVYASRGLWGFCYTQLCDVEQEINGMLTSGRLPKCGVEKIRSINEQYHCHRLFP